MMLFVSTIVFSVSMNTQFVALDQASLDRACCPGEAVAAQVELALPLSILPEILAQDVRPVQDLDVPAMPAPEELTVKPPDEDEQAWSKREDEMPGEQSEALPDEQDAADEQVLLPQPKLKDVYAAFSSLVRQFALTVPRMLMKADMPLPADLP